MDKINLKDIIGGSLKTLPYELEQPEKIDFAKSLIDALEAFMYERYPNGIKEKVTRIEKRVQSVGFLKQETEVTVEYEELIPDDMVEAGDNVLAFLLDNDFDTDIIIQAMITALRYKEIRFKSDTDTFGRVYDRISGLLVHYDDE